MAKVLSKPSPLRSGSYKNATNRFFERSKLFDAQITDLFDGFWPTVTALKNLRWQVRGYHENYDLPENSDLTNKFVERDDVTNRPNLYRVFIDEGWQITEDRLVQNLLINMFACYEGWCEDISTLLSLQDPTGQVFQKVSQQADNFATFFTTIQGGGTTQVADSYYDVFRRKSKGYNVTLLDNWLKEFRYFKECRNAMVHHAGFATDRVVNAYAEISGFAAVDLDLPELPIVPNVNIGDSIHLSLRSVVGFSQVIRRLVETFDIELIKVPNSQTYYLGKIREVFPARYPTNMTKVRNQVRSISARSHFGYPDNEMDLYTLLRTKQIMR